VDYAIEKDIMVMQYTKKEGMRMQTQKLYSNRKFVGSFKVDPELWSRFKLETKLRGVSICHVLEALIEAWIEGQRATATVIKPVTINLTMQHIVERPRRKGEIQPCVPDPYQCAEKCAKEFKRRFQDQ